MTRQHSRSIVDALEVAARNCQRFLVPRGSMPDLSDDGFLAEFDERYAAFTNPIAVPLEALPDTPVLCLLGEPGMGKSTVLDQEARRLTGLAGAHGDHVLTVDLAACGSDVTVRERTFQSELFLEWKVGSRRLHLLLDGLDTCLQSVRPLVALLLDGLEGKPLERLSLRISCRTAEWPPDFEAGLQDLWHRFCRRDEEPIGVFELAPLRKADVLAAVEATGLSGELFLKEVERVGGAQFANRPITLKFLLNSFGAGLGLPSEKAVLYREGTRVLCDEWRHDRRRNRHPLSLSSGLRFAVAGRLAAVSVLSCRAAISTAPRGDVVADGDVRSDDLLGEERYGRESVQLGEQAVRETLDTGLFRTLGPNRFAFSHQTYAEYLAAQYLVDRKLPASDILGLILADGSGKVVPQLRETASWLAALVPEVRKALISGDPLALLSSDTPPTSESDRRELVRETLSRYDSGEATDLRIIVAVGGLREGAFLQYEGIATDLRPYVLDASHNETVRHAAILIVRFARVTELQKALLNVALNDTEPYAVRAAAAAAISILGDEASQADLKPLLKSSPVNDPKDELKGAALAACWPHNLTADELFESLTSPQQTNFIGKYRQFLASDFAAAISPGGMIAGLRWARPHLTRPNAESQPMGAAALSVVTAAIDHFGEPEVCSELADVLLQVARVPVPALRLMTKLSSHQEARSAIARAAIRRAGKPEEIRLSIHYGLITEKDVPWLLQELPNLPAGLEQEKVAFVLAEVTVLPVRRCDAVLQNQVTAAAETIPILAEALKWASKHKKELERKLAERNAAIRTPEPDGPQPAPGVDDLIAAGEADTDATLFQSICYRLAGPDWSPDEELLPGWNDLPAHTRQQIIRAAEAYLTGYRLPTESWIETAQVWYPVTCGYGALRLLAQFARDALVSLSADVWDAWMPAAFGEHFRREPPDGVQAEILKTGYKSAPARFLELLRRFIEVQKRVYGDVFILDKADPVWDRNVADMVRPMLEDQRLTPEAFRHVLAALIRHGDDRAFVVACDLVKGAGNAQATELERPLEAAREMLENDPGGAWQLVWTVAQANLEMSRRLLSRFAVDPYSSATSRLLRGIRERQLADLWLWLSTHQMGQGSEQEEPSVPTVHMFIAFNGSGTAGWYWLRLVVLNALIERGTSEAVEAIRQLSAKFPRENLKRALEAAEEVVRQYSWRPLSPSEFIALVAGLDSHRPEARPKLFDSIQIELRRLKSSRAALDNLDGIILSALQADPHYRVQLPQWSSVKVVLDGLDYITDLPKGFAFDENPNVVRLQIHATRARIEDRINLIEDHPEQYAGEFRPRVTRESTPSVLAAAELPAKPAPDEPPGQRPRGAPRKAVAEKTRAHWAEMGRPKLTAKVCDALAKHTYADEYAKATLRSPLRKRLRDRVRRQVKPLIAKATSTTLAT